MAWVAHSEIMTLWPRTLLWTAGLLFAKMAMHLMLAHLCDEPFNPVRRTFVAVGVVALGLWCAPALPISCPPPRRIWRSVRRCSDVEIARGLPPFLSTSA